MSEYNFDCPHCGQSLEAPEDMLGETIDCPSCGGKLDLPKPESSPPPRPRPQRPHPQHPQQRAQRKQPVETNVKQGALIGGVVCFVLGVIMMCVSLWTVIVYAPLFLAAFVLSIVAMAQKRIAGGVILLVLTVAVPPVLLIAVPSFKTARSAAQEAAQARAAVAATVEKEPEVVRTAAVSEPSERDREPEPEPKPEPQAKPALPTNPVFRFNLTSLPSLPKGEEARLMVVPAYHYNDVWEMLGDRELRVTFGGEKFYVYVERDGFILTRSAVQELVSLMEKYRDWKTKALAMGTTVQKDIGTLSVEIFWKTYDDEWHFGTRPVTAVCSFFSQNKQRHQMTMQFEKVGSTQNEYIDHRLETIYFDSEGVNAFLEAFSRANIDKKVAEHKRQKQLESQFQ